MPFLILMQTSTVGSSWLAGMLDSHPRIRVKGEYPMQSYSAARLYAWFGSYPYGLRFERPRRAAPRDAHGDATAVNATAPPAPAPAPSSRRPSRAPPLLAAGFKVKLPVLRGAHPDAGQMRGLDRWPGVLQALRCLGASLLCLGRANSAKHAVSMVRQRQQYRACHAWTLTAASGPRGIPGAPACHRRLRGANVSVAAWRKDLRAARATRADLDRSCDAAARALGAARVRRVEYEELAYGDAAARERAWTGVQRWLGVEPAPLRSGVVKMTSPVLRGGALRNFEELLGSASRAFGPRSEEVRWLMSEAS